VRLVEVRVQVPVEVAGVTEAYKARRIGGRAHIDAVVFIQRERRLPIHADDRVLTLHSDADRGALRKYDGAVHNDKGLDIEALMKHKQESGSITDFAGGENIDREEALFQECEVLVPAAKENVITSRNAHRIRAKILCEGANGPSTAESDAILQQNNVFVIPDILANAGGVTVSYFEWVQDRQGFFWNEQLVNGRLEEIMINSFRDIVAYAESHKVDNRTAAYMVALDRVVFAIKTRGIYA